MSASTLSSTGLRPEAQAWQDGKRYLWPLALVVPVLPYVGYGLWHRFPFGGFGDDHHERCDIAAAALNAARLHIDGQMNGKTVASSYGSALGQIVVIGDTPNDITCGRAIGARCVAVPTGFTKADDLRRSNPDLLVETLEDIEPILALLEK